MTFQNLQVSLDSLPRSGEVEYQHVDPRYAPVVLGVTVAVLLPILLAAMALIYLVLIPRAGLPAVAAVIISALLAGFSVFIIWHSWRMARVVRYAIRQHDVIVRSGVFWQRETVQPIRRIQHVEQHQGPVDKRYGLYELKLFSAGTGHFTFRIPGLDGQAATRIKQFILDVQQDDWSEDAADGAVSVPREQPVHTGPATEPTHD